MLFRSDPAALRKLKLARHEAWLLRLNARAEEWVPEIRRLRPHAPWDDVLRMINARLSPDRHWSLARLKRAAKAWVAEGLLEPTVLRPAPRRLASDRLPALIAAIKGADPDMTLAAMRDRLQTMREPTPRGRGQWQISSVAMLLTRAEQLGLLRPRS